MKKIFLFLLFGTALQQTKAQQAPRQNAHRSESLQTHLQQGRAHLDAGEYYSALKDGNAAVSQAPNNTNALTLRGLARSFTNDYRGAALDYTAAINSTSSPAGNLFYWRAQMKEKTGDPSEAAADYQRLLQIKPGHTKATEALARLNSSQQSGTPKVQTVNASDDNRPFMKSVGKLNEALQAIMDEKAEVTGMIDQLYRAKRRLQAGMIELEAYHDPKWPI